MSCQVLHVGLHLVRHMLEACRPSAVSILPPVTMLYNRPKALEPSLGSNSHLHGQYCMSVRAGLH